MMSVALHAPFGLVNEPAQQEEHNGSTGVQPVKRFWRSPKPVRAQAGTAQQR